MSRGMCDEDIEGGLWGSLVKDTMRETIGSRVPHT